MAAMDDYEEAQEENANTLSNLREPPIGAPLVMSRYLQ